MRGVAVQTQLLLLVAASFAGCSSPVAAPTGYANYNAKDAEFKCDYPQGWEASGGSGGKRPWAKFAQGNALIHVQSDMLGAIVAAPIGGSLGGGDVDPEETPIALAHEMGKSKAAEDRGNYQEIGAPKDFSTALGPARSSEFTASGTFGGKQHGYRATILSLDLRYVIYCTCSEADWNTLRPAFDKVLASFARGKAGT